MKKTKRHYVMTARAAKAQATRARIRASANQLYSERALEDFTLEEVAQRAETTVQTVLRAFGSKDELIFSALEELAGSGVPVKSTTPGDVAAYVNAIFDIYEAMGDLVIQRLSEERRRPGLKPALDRGRKAHTDGLTIAFAPQLQRQSGSARKQLFQILLAATDVYVWKLLRRDQKLSRPAAEAIVCRMIGSVTKTEKTDGEDLVAELVRRREPAS
ncbi:MAG: TetR/AcrR family transcriptional regulator [Xanthobacteraceae bacterium]